jgi:hypothetical protein
LTLQNSFGLVLIGYPDEPEHQSRGLDHGLVAQKPFGVGLPGTVDGVVAAILVAGERLAVHLVEILPDGDGMAAVLAVHHALRPFRARFGAGQFHEFVRRAEFHAVEVGVLIDDPRRAAHPDYRQDAVLLVGIAIDFLGERIQAVLIGHDQQGHHLLVGHRCGAGFLPERGGLENFDDLGLVDGKAFGEFLDQLVVQGCLL